MEDISFGQISIALCFISLLIFAQFYIKKNKFKLKDKWSLNKRIQLIETFKFNAGEKVQIIKVDASEYLYFLSKGSQPVIMPLCEISNQATAKNLKETRRSPGISVKPPAAKRKNENQHNNQESKSDNKMLEAITIARKLNPKVTFK